MKKKKKRINLASLVFFFAIVCGALAAYFGWLGYLAGEQLNANLATSFGSIALTILVLDRLNQWRTANERKCEIIDQMGSMIGVMERKIRQRLHWGEFTHLRTSACQDFDCFVSGGRQR